MDGQEDETLTPGGRNARAQRLARASVALTVVFAAYNLGVAAFTPHPNLWSSFPLGGSLNARYALAIAALVVAFLGFRLHTRRLLPWLGLAAVLVWAAGGLAVTRAPFWWLRAVPPLALAGFLIANQHRLTARSPWARNSLRAGAIYFIVTIFIASVLGARAIGDQYEPPLETWVDTLYYVVITFTTVGYGDIVPATPQARFVAVTMVGLAFTAIALAGAILAPPILRSQFKEVSMAAEHAATQTLNDHIIIAGASPEAHSLVRALQDRAVDVALIHHDHAFIEEFSEVDFPVIEGAPSRRESLEAASLEDARALVACDEDDAVNAFILLTARELAPDVRRVAMATDPENVEKLRLAGADAVISPSVVGGSLLGHAALGETGRVEDLWTGDAGGAGEAESAQRAENATEEAHEAATTR